MKILFLCHRFPFPPDSGSKIRSFNIIRHLSHEHRVSVVSMVRSSEEAASGKGLLPHCDAYEMAQVSTWAQAARTALCVPTRTPSSMGYFYSPAMASTVARLLREQTFDLIFVHSSSVAQYVEPVQHIPKILDFCDMDSQKWLTYARYKSFPMNAGYWFEGSKLVREEKRLARRFDLCTVTTRVEWETLRNYGRDIACDWFANGVDTDYFSPTDQPCDPDLISFVGRMDYFPNQECMADFCTSVLPILQARRPALRLQIVGANPSPAVRRLAELPGIIVTGFVPDIRPYLHRSALMVAPLNIARGIQNKILEGMACGLPVVTSDIAARGVDAHPGVHLRVCRSADDYASTILEILADPSLRQRLALAARDRMISHHAWSRSMTTLDSLIGRAITNHQALTRPKAA